ncbi:MAG: threonine synthase [Armatimonadota bacterium]|nr:MAG: threonine synthase [Armatimonadota bacterium]
MSYRGVIERYRDLLPVTDATPVVTLLEGDTPLIEAPRLAEGIGLPLRLYLKYEGLNPTGSFKDRGMTVAISKAVEEGSQAVICASTGNTAASAAAYAARAGMRCAVVIPEGHIAMGKLAQSMIQGAQVMELKGNFDECLRVVREITERYPITLVNSLNPNRIEGQKTGAYEICDTLGDAPEYHALPVGNAGNITAYWKGYKEYQALGRVPRVPKMLGFQAEGAAPIVCGHPIERPETIATAIRIGNPASWQQAEAARDESGGVIDTVSDDEIILAYRMLANLEGLFVEPASAASVAGVRKLAASGYFDGAAADARVVCVLTGHGLKDPDRAIAVAEEPLRMPAHTEAVADALQLTQEPTQVA